MFGSCKSASSAASTEKHERRAPVCLTDSRCCALRGLCVNSCAMGLLTFGLNVTLDGCIDHTQGIADDELHDY